MPDTPNKVGRPTDYKPEYCEKIIQLAALGCTTKQIAILFDVTPRTVENWKRDHPEFLQAINLAKLQADIDVAYSLYKNATRNNNFAAQAWWLKNRCPEQWSDKQSLDLRTPDGIQLSVIDRAQLDAMSPAEREEVERKLQEAVMLAQQLQLKSES